MSSKIYSINAREILDSRGIPTVEATVILDSGHRGVAAAPSGTSIGSQEALELRDQVPARWGGMGVQKAVGNINNYLSLKLAGLEAGDQQLVDNTILELDGTPNKARVGANATIAVSLATAVAAANYIRLPLYLYLYNLMKTRFSYTLDRLPTPVMNLINGGAHAADNLNFQEFQVVPASNLAYSQALMMGSDIYRELKMILKSKNLPTSVGEEGGFAPVLATNTDALESLTTAIKNLNLHLGNEVFLGLDLAANHFWASAGYQIKDRTNPYLSSEFSGFLIELARKYHLLLIEDPLEESDWSGWTELVKNIGKNAFIVGDDFLVTNSSLLSRAIAEKAATAIIIKPNQAGTLSETINVILLAKAHDIKISISHRSGETADTFVADLAVAAQADYVKFGAPVRGERVAKYNRLLAIETEMMTKK